MALLQYKSPQAQILYGAGNQNIKPEDIKAFISAPGRTDDEILSAAIGHGVSVDQINAAMGGDPGYTKENMGSFLASKGISSETSETSVPQTFTRPEPVSYTPVSQPEPVSYTPVSQPEPVKSTPLLLDTKTDTVEGRIGGLLQDPTHPLNVQAQTFGNQMANKRGLLNSSIAVSAAQDAMYKNLYPIAAHDASTSYDAKRTNSAQDLQANMFNADLGSKVGMFNSDQGLKAGMFSTDLGAKVGMFNADQGLRSNMFNNEIGRDYSRMNLDYFTSTLDADTRMNVANMQARSTETGIMGELSRNYMDMYARIAADNNMSADAKKEVISNLQSMYTSSVGMMDTFAASAKRLSEPFGKVASNTAETTATSSQPADASVPTGTVTQRSDGAVASPGSDGKIGSWGSVIPKQDGKGYKLTVLAGVRPALFDSADYALSAGEISDIKAFEATTGVTIDKMDVVPVSLINEVKRLNPSNMDAKMFVPVPIPGSRRADNLSFYLYSAALPKYQPK